MNNVRIEADNIVFSYGEPRVLRNISLGIEAGELFAVVGPSGSGKTTLLRVIAGLEQPSTGTIRINGTNVNDIPLTQRNIGMVFQNFSLWPHMTVFENVAFGVSRHDLHGETVKARVDRILAILDIQETRDARPAYLSAGQQQRVAAARALIGQPELIVADEPTSALDTDRQDAFLDLLLRETSATGSTLVFVSHDARLATHFDRCVTMAEIARNAAPGA